MADQPLGCDSTGRPIRLVDIWPSDDEVDTYVRRYVTPETYRRAYDPDALARSSWSEIVAPIGAQFPWDPGSTYVQRPPFFTSETRSVGISDLAGARPLAVLGDNITTDHISPFGRILSSSAAARYLKQHGVPENEWSSYAERRGKLVLRGQIANPVTLKNLFDQDGALAEIGGAQYLVQLAQAVVTVINAEDYGRAIHDLFLRRQLIGVGEDIVNESYTYDPDISAIDQIERSEMRLFNLAEGGQVEGGPKKFDVVLKSALDMAEVAYKRDSHVTGVPSGLRDLDRKLGGLQPSDLVILAGRPSMGKTALATNIGFNAAEAVKDAETGTRHRVAFFSLEMSAEQLAHRIMAEKSGISSDRIRRGDVKSDDFGRIVEAAQAMTNVQFFIDDTPAMTVPGLRTRARRLKRQFGLDLIVVDYLQLMRSANPKPSDNRVQEISEITRGLKAIAKELQVPVRRARPWGSSCAGPAHTMWPSAMASAPRSIMAVGSSLTTVARRASVSSRSQSDIAIPFAGPA